MIEHPNSKFKFPWINDIYKSNDSLVFKSNMSTLILNFKMFSCEKIYFLTSGLFWILKLLQWPTEWSSLNELSFSFKPFALLILSVEVSALISHVFMINSLIYF